MADVRLATPDDVPAIGRTLAAAFDGDPVWSWLASSRAAWMPAATAWFTAYARYQVAHHAEVWVDDEVRGCAVWLPPDRWRSTLGEAVAVTVPSARLFRGKLLTAMRNMGSVEKAHPKEPPHWYLGVIGTDPAHQGVGVGSALIATVTDRCDAEGLGAYLESSKEQNVPYYARHGFDVVAEIRFSGDGPTMWRMWRDPKG